MSELHQLTPNRPYMIRAIYEWLSDNNLTPYILVDTSQKGVIVPSQHIQDNQIILNIVAHAVHQLDISNDAIQFSARFSGVSQDIYVPMSSVLGIYAKENGVGLFFDPSEYEHLETTQETPKEETPTTKKSRFTLVD